MKKGLISVVLPVYNGEKFLAESIDSVLNQTYKEFELIIVIDGSKDQSLEIARSYNDPRIRIHLNPINLGLVGALNVGLEQCTGEFIARMDQDDISVTSRFEKQINYLNLNPNVGVLGTAYRIFGREEKDMILPQSNDQIKLLSFFKNPFCHPSVMFRRSVLEKYSLRYNENFKDVEDWRMWVEFVALNIEMANLPDILLLYRIEGQSTTPQSNNIRIEQYKNIYRENLKMIFEKLDESEIDLHWNFSSLYIGNIKLNSYNNYIKKFSNLLISKGYKKSDINLVLEPYLVRFMYKITDRSALQGLRVMFKFGLYKYFNFFYFFKRLVDLKKRDQSEFQIKG